MKILVYGAGSIGCVFGGFLSKAGEDVVLLGRVAQMEAVKAKGLHIEGIWGIHDVKDMLAYSNSEHLKEDHAGTFDLILLTVKAYDTVSAMADIVNMTNNNTYILSLQNGLGNVEAITKSAGAEQTLGGRIIFGVETVHPGSVKVTVSADDVVIGRVSQNTSNEKVEEIASLLTFAGIKTRTTLEIDKFIWGKVIYNCALNGLASILNVNYGQLLDSEYTKDILRRIVAEIYLVAQKKEIELDPKTKEEYIKTLFNRLIPLTSSQRASMLQDTEKDKKTEIDSLNGAIVRMGKDVGIPTPANQLITELIKYKEMKR
jgi:2-dehydropantoate 2-reductase